MTLQIICAALALVVLFDWVLAWSQRRLIVGLKEKLANEEGAHRDQVEIGEIIQRRLNERVESLLATNADLNERVESLLATNADLAEKLADALTKRSKKR